MKNKWLLLVLMHIAMTTVLFAQKNTRTLSFEPVWSSAALQLDSVYYHIGEKDSLKLTTCKWYVSNIQLWQDDQLVWSEENSFHLIDASEKNSWIISYSIPLKKSFNKIKFKLGIDSSTSVAGVLKGDMDPIKGMYWAWQSGYINVKLEGKSTLCATRNQEFQFHLGGYQSPFNACKTIVLPVVNKAQIRVTVDVAKWFAGIPLKEWNHVMIPGMEAMQLSEKWTECFSLR